MASTDMDAAAVLKAVRDVVPQLQDNAREAEERRWIPDQNIDLLENAGVFQIAVPRRFGGLDLPLASGTGSSTSTAKDVFVLTHRVVDGYEAMEGTTGDRSNTGANGRNYALIPQGLSLHGLISPMGGMEVHGRVLLGLDPDTEYL